MAVTAEVPDLHQPPTDAEVETVLRPALDAIDPLAEPESENGPSGLISGRRAG